MPKGKIEKLTKQQAMLFFYAGLLHWGTKGKDTRWSKEDWNRLLDHLSHREIAVVALKEFRDMTDTRVGELLGISRSMVNINWNNAKKKIIERFSINPFDRLL